MATTPNAAQALAVAVPPSREEIDVAISRGVAFLLASQRKDGSWGSADHTKGGLDIYAPVPGAHQAFRAAVTAMCISALIEVGGDGQPAQTAIDLGEKWLLEHLPKVRRATPVAIYNNWTHGYAIECLVHMYRRRPQDAARQQEIIKLIQLQMELLGRYESIDGGWGYYDFRAGAQRPTSSSTSFMTASILIAFDEAKQIGVLAPDKLVERAKASLYRQQKSDRSYLYGEYLKWLPMHPVNRPGGSLGRSQACNVALRRWGDDKVTDELLESWLNRLFDRNLWLDIGRKRPIPHEAWFAVAGYFFYFGHYYAALAIEELPAEARRPYQDRLAKVLVPLQEKDGSWWDFPFYDYHQAYGTAFALTSLHRCR